MVWWLVVCFEDRSERDKNKRNVFLMCLGTVCTDMMMMGCVCVCDGPYTVYTLLLLLLLFQRFCVNDKRQTFPYPGHAFKDVFKECVAQPILYTKGYVPRSICWSLRDIGGY